MPIIKPRTSQKHFVRHITRLYTENNETLFAYSEFIQEPTEYILNQLIDTVLTKDREFQQWRIEHSESFVKKRDASAEPQQPRRTRRARNASPTDAPSELRGGTIPSPHATNPQRT
jgi:hypothetical protein